MRKKLQLLFILLIGLFCKSQDNSLAASVLTPVSYQTGVPDISYPLASLPASKDFTINFALIYNPNSYEGGDYSGTIGRNWMLGGSNFMISRKVNDVPDEANGYTGEWDDLYYYDLNGEQGSFKFEKTGVYPNEVYNIRKLTPSNIKIECERTPTGYTWDSKQIKSFTITDSKGYKYYFQDYEYRQFAGVFGYPPLSAKTNIHITKVEDQSNNIIAAYKYIRNTPYDGNSSELYDGVTGMIESVTTNYGKIIFNHEVVGDYYYKSLTLLDHKDKFISKYEFENYTVSYKYYDLDKFQTIEPVTIYSRYLSTLKKIDKTSNIIDLTRFDYTTVQPTPPTWGSVIPAGVYQKGDFLMNGLLKTVKLSTGAKIEYEFQYHTLKLNTPVDYNNPTDIGHIQDPLYSIISPFSFTKKTDSIWFDSKISKIYHLNNLHYSPNTKVYIKFKKDELYPYDSGSGPTNPTLGIPTPDPKLAYKVKNSTDGSSSPEIEDEYYQKLITSNGSYLEITGSGGKGWFEIYEKFWTDPPYTILNSASSNCGVRIDNIKYYDRGQEFNSSYPNYDLKKVISLDYNLFNEPGVSSGVSVIDDQETIIYKNIKVTESDKDGYTKYYDKIPDDFFIYTTPDDPNTILRPVFNFTKKGLLSKKEIYTSNNIRTRSDEYGYVFPSYATMPVSDLLMENLIPEKITTANTSYDSAGNALTDTSERTFNQDNNNLMTEKKTSADGTVSETSYKYAAEKGNTKLLGALMTSVPLEVTQKQNNIQTGKLETKYDQAGNYFPSSVTSFGINNVITGEQSNEYYDNMGNVLQTRSKSGITTAVIWGYNGTQPIAKIEGGEYYNILALLGQTDANLIDIVQKSNLDVDSSDNTNEQLLRNALEAFRKKPEFKNYLITTYTYDPLIGIKSVTSPNGMTEYYFYDDQNRLIRVEDTDHHVIKENKYLQNVYQD